jgi:hypothetical protein
MDETILLADKSHLRNLCKNIAYIIEVVPLCAPPLHIFRASLSAARPVFWELLDWHYYGFMDPSAGQLDKALSRTGPYRFNNNLDQWHRLLVSYSSGRVALTKGFKEVVKDIEEVAKLSRRPLWFNSRAAERLHLRFQLHMGIFTAILRGLRAMERDYMPRDFKTAKIALEAGLVGEYLGGKEPGEVGEIDVLFLNAADLAMVRPMEGNLDSKDACSTVKVEGPKSVMQNAAIWRWRQDTRLMQKEDEEAALTKDFTWDWLRKVSWHKIQLPPQVALPPEERATRRRRRRSLLP